MKGFRSSDLSERQYAAIGKVACEWAHVENTLRHYLHAITKINDSICWKITAELGNVSLLNLIYAVSYDEEKDVQASPLYQHLKAAEPTLTDLRGKRNTVVHMDWLVGRPRGSVHAIKIQAKGKLVMKLEIWTAKKMDELAETIAGFNRVLWQHILDYQAGRLLPLPAKPQRQSRKGQKSP